MKAALTPLLMAALGAGLGAGAAVMLAGDAPAEEAGDGHAAPEKHEGDAHGDEAARGSGSDHGRVEAAHGPGHGSDKGASGGGTFVPMRNQFVVPMLDEGRTYALVAISLSLEVAPGAREAAVSSEPRLRDALLGALFDHANTGGFAGDFTAEARLAALRRTLTESARAAVGDGVLDVLIQDISRQDV